MRCGLLGQTLAHSHSPLLHSLLGDYAYTLFEKAPDQVEDFLKNGSWDGLNVTIPYKKTAYALCDSLSPIARETGNVNTLLRRRDGSIFGDNTDAFGFESLFMHCWRLRERVLDIFEKTTGGRVIFSVVKVGGVVRDVDDAMFAYIKQVLEGLKDEYRQIMNTLLTDSSVKNRLVGVGYVSHDDAVAESMVGPFGRASGVNYDVRMLGNGWYGKLSEFQPILSNDGDCYARVQVRCLEVLQSIDIIEEVISRMPSGDIEVKVKGNPADGAEACNVLEQPRGECYYYARGNGTKFLERMRMRTPTSQNIAGMTIALKGCDLADVNNIILTIDPCISCTER